MWLAAMLGALAAAFFKHVSVNYEKGGGAKLYKIGKNAAFVTNKKAKTAAACSARNYFAENIFGGRFR